MKILVVGSGGREHALVWAFSKSKRVTEIFCANGNAGIAETAKLVNLSPNQIEELAEFAEQNRIDLTFVGGETSLALGIADEFEKRGLKVVGASKAAARLESSKAFAKDFMLRNEIPTAEYATANSPAEAVEILESGKFGDENTPVVIKADGLAAGKGVVVAQNRREAVEAVESMTSGKLIDSEAASTIVIEECLHGREVSLIMFADGKTFALMPPTRDHKRIGEGDTGANTGGMGTITDASLLSAQETQVIIEKIIKPTLRGAETENFSFRGVLFLGLMLTDSGAKVLEYNVRFGDPEAQAILVNLQTDLVEICEAIIAQKLDKILIEWQEGSSACVILAAENYPKAPRKGDLIRGLDEAARQENIEIFHAGTARNEAGEFITAGGRVLSVTATASNLSNAIHRAYKAVNEISFEGMQYRSDIGK